MTQMDDFQTRKEAFVRDFRDMIDHFERCWLEMDEKLVKANASWHALLDFSFKDEGDSEIKRLVDNMGVFRLQAQAERIRLRKQVINFNRVVLAKFEAARTPEQLFQVAEEIGKEIERGWQ